MGHGAQFPPRQPQPQIQTHENKTHETLAVDLNQEIEEGKAKLFSVAEMWNLRKNFRSASDYRNWN